MKREKGTSRRGSTEPGREKTPDVEADPHAFARTIALRQLTMAPRSRAQLAEKMTAKEVPEAVVAEVLDRFEEVGLVDDKAFAEGFVTARQGNRGKRALSLELRRKGIDEDTAVEALEVVDDDSEEFAARALLRRPLIATRGMDKVKRQRRLVGMLARRGFSPGMVMRVVREQLGMDAEENPDD